MHSRFRAPMLAVLVFATTVILAVATALGAALAYGATALIVPGTGTSDSDAIAGYRENAWSRFISPECVGDCADPALIGIPYPASFWPFSFLPRWCVPGRCEKWDVSVDEGIENLVAALDPFLDPASQEDVFIFGYSQGGAVVATVLADLGERGLSDAVKNRLKVVTIGNIENPDGGLWQRLAWLRYLLGEPVPILDVSFEPAMPIDTGIGSTTIGFEYDPVVYAPLYWGNPFAIANLLAAFDTVHGYYLAPNEEDPGLPMPYGYTDETLAPQLNCDLNPGNCRTDSYGNTYIMIPATSLPLTNVVRNLADSLGVGWLAKPFIDLTEPVLRELVDLGFDWSGNPGVSRGLSILPFNLFQNWFQVGIDLAKAAVEGIEAFIANFVPPRAPEAPEGSTVPTERSAQNRLTSTELADETATEAETETETETVTEPETVTDETTVEDETVEDETVTDETTTDETATDETDTVTGDDTVTDEDAEETDPDAESTDSIESTESTAGETPAAA
ncbi:PE-PPE domain-containing protein [Mycobacterium sp. ITM-2016-00317]|uniref:PE-PPE domain-containing protein n=1 Tax=Mycobacterium sp. ITM-2016-00317 TaxID=2099694 RepID=UPI00287F9A97|nr:PE-PPE domain-containing protein [Mycobacterium sp. ITM-2016-00317]WNG88625.1 PE-PPE domain-containing protein [Mycobacterium sp. ITM-2016-00317]